MHFKKITWMRPWMSREGRKAAVRPTLVSTVLVMALVFGPTDEARGESQKLVGAHRQTHYDDDGRVVLTTSGDFELTGKEAAYTAKLDYGEGEVRTGILAASDGLSTYTSTQVLRIDQDSRITSDVLSRMPARGEFRVGIIPKEINDRSVTQLLVFAYLTTSLRSRIAEGNRIKPEFIPDIVLQDAKYGASSVVGEIITGADKKITKIAFWGIAPDNLEGTLTDDGKGSFLLGEIQYQAISNSFPIRFSFSRFNRHPSVSPNEFFKALSMADAGSKERQELMGFKGKLHDFYLKHVSWIPVVIRRYEYEGNLVAAPEEVTPVSYAAVRSVKVADFRLGGSQGVSYNLGADNRPSFDVKSLGDIGAPWRRRVIVTIAWIISTLVFTSFCIVNINPKQYEI